MLDCEITTSSGNVFEDLGLPDSKEMLVKSDLAIIIQALIHDQGLTQTSAARLMGLTQPKLSDLLKGKFRGISEAKLLECITRLGRDIRIEVLPLPPQGTHSSPGRIQVCCL